MREFICLIPLMILICIAKPSNSKESEKEKPSWTKKDIRDYTDADMERLLDQWEEGDDPLEPDELPEHLRPSPQIDLSKIDTTNPDDLIRMTKKGKGLMIFVGLKKKFSRDQTETITQIWQTSLHNNHIIVERYMIDDNRAIFMFRDGAQVIDAKQYLLEQPELNEITIEGQTIPGKHAHDIRTDSKTKTSKSSHGDQSKTGKKQKSQGGKKKEEL